MALQIFLTSLMFFIGSIFVCIFTQEDADDVVPEHCAIRLGRLALFWCSQRPLVDLELTADSRYPDWFR